MRFLLIGDVFHPEELASTSDKANPTLSPLFPASQAEFFFVRALRGSGHDVDAFIRNVPIFGAGLKHSQRFTSARTLRALFAALGRRLPYFSPDYRWRNDHLMQRVRQFRPDVILCMGGNRVIFPETFEAIKQRYGPKLILLTGDSPLIFSSRLERRSAPLYDLVAVNDLYHGQEWLGLGAKRMVVLPLSACDPDYHFPHVLTSTEMDSYGCNVGFVGTLVPDTLYSKRVEALGALRDCGLGIWSIHEIPESLRAYYRGPALGEKMLRILAASKIQTNPHGDSMRYGGNMRLFEAAGCGVFQIADDLPGISTWFTSGKNIVVYRDPAHLHELASYYLAHESEAKGIAEAARSHVYAAHTYAQRISKLIDLLAL